MTHGVTNDERPVYLITNFGNSLTVSGSGAAYRLRRCAGEGYICT